MTTLPNGVIYAYGGPGKVSWFDAGVINGVSCQGDTNEPEFTKTEQDFINWICTGSNSGCVPKPCPGGSILPGGSVGTLLLIGAGVLALMLLRGKK